MGRFGTQPSRCSVAMVRASIIHVHDKNQRQKLRRQLGSLNLNLVKRITVARYAEHFNKFAGYLKDTRRLWPATSEEFDMVASEYLEVLWDLGEPKTTATYTLASIHYYLPQLNESCLAAGSLRQYGISWSSHAKLYHWILTPYLQWSPIFGLWVYSP